MITEEINRVLTERNKVNADLLFFLDKEQNKKDGNT
jgi:hypothetical protein